MPSASVTELRDIDLALASYPESEWAEPWPARRCSRACATPSASTRTSCAAPCGARCCWRQRPAIPSDALGAADARAVTALSDELASGERAARLADAIRSDLARATGAHLPRAAAVLRELAAPHEDPQLAWRLFCAALLAAAALDDE